MATPKFDQIAAEFLKKIPDKFQTTFIPGDGEMPDGYVLTKEQIADYVNRALHKLFDDVWIELKGVKEDFVRVFPELIDTTENISLPYIIGNEEKYKNFYKPLGAIRASDGLYFRIWSEDKLTLAMSAKTIKYRATENNPAIIQNKNILMVFPTDLEDTTVKVQYIKFPNNPETGEFLSQNGSYDSPYDATRNSRLANIAFELYLQDTQQTS